MKKLIVLPVLAFLALPVLAGRDSPAFRCENECPLAKQANLHRSFGTEAALVSTIARAELIARVEQSLSRI